MSAEVVSLDLVRSLRFTEKQEGGWANDKHDRGKRTRWGVSSISNPEVNLDTLTRAGAAKIFERKYWFPAHCHELPWPISLVIFDYSIHSGVRRAVKTIQRVIGAKADGAWGFKSREALVNALSKQAPSEIAMECVRKRKRFMVNGFRKAIFSPMEPLRYLAGFWKRTLDLTFEVGAASAEERMAV